MIVIKKEDLTIFTIAYNKAFSDNPSYNVENNGDYYSITFTNASDDSIFKLGMCFNELKQENTKPLSQSLPTITHCFKAPKLKTYYMIVVLTIFILFYFSIDSLMLIDNKLDNIKQKSSFPPSLDSTLTEKQKTGIHDTINKTSNSTMRPR